MWADYDLDGARDAEEPFAVTDKQGRYVIYDIRPPAGTYTLREKPYAGSPAVSPNWRCSFPHAGTPGGGAAFPGGQLSCGWGPIDATATPNATGKDFGNWFPAQLTVEKRAGPGRRAGRVRPSGRRARGRAGGRERLESDGRGAAGHLHGVRAAGGHHERGRFPIERCGAGGTCRERGGCGTGTVSGQLELAAGQHGTCTFINLYDPAPPGPAVPLLVIRKTGPATATAGETLSYSLLVVEPGRGGVPGRRRDGDRRDMR